MDIGDLEKSTVPARGVGGTPPGPPRGLGVPGGFGHPGRVLPGGELSRGWSGYPGVGLPGDVCGFPGKDKIHGAPPGVSPPNALPRAWYGIVTRGRRLAKNQPKKQPAPRKKREPTAPAVFLPGDDRCRLHRPPPPPGEGSWVARRTPRCNGPRTPPRPTQPNPPPAAVGPPACPPQRIRPASFIVTVNRCVAPRRTRLDLHPLGRPPRGRSAFVRPGFRPVRLGRRKPMAGVPRASNGPFAAGAPRPRG